MPDGQGKEFQLISNGAQVRKEGRRRSILPVLKTALRNDKSMHKGQRSSKWRRTAENAKSVRFVDSDIRRDASLSGGSSGKTDGEELTLQRAMEEMDIGKLKKPQVQVKHLRNID